MKKKKKKQSSGIAGPGKPNHSAGSILLGSTRGPAVVASTAGFHFARPSS